MAGVFQNAHQFDSADIGGAGVECRRHDQDGNGIGRGRSRNHRRAADGGTTRHAV
jgi:hypothetical protein